MKKRKIIFPADELPHDNIIEWWYFNGHLTDQAGKQYSFMDCFFRTDPKRVNLPFLKHLPFKHSYFHHSLLSAINGKKFISEVHPLVVISKDSFSKKDLFINYAELGLNGYFNYVIEKVEENRYHAKTQNFDLWFTNHKKPLLVGGDGFLDLGVNSTFYYSLTNMSVVGEVILGNKRLPVKGIGWMDHQWADAVYAPFKWNWFSIQLKNGVEIMAFIFIGQNQKATKLVSIIAANGQQKNFFDPEIYATPNTWVSQQTGISYNLNWRVRVESEGVDLEINPLLEKQEMIFGPISYWEGPVAVKGRLGGKPAVGQGFMELVGNDQKKSKLAIQSKKISNDIKKRLKKYF
ncbi:MAG: hypothetical protein JW816_01555 [Candidatus Buchananbacteria bacterium]|nr:hypothetical protein [Candidatus Buchananbacteria bacterium]